MAGLALVRSGDEVLRRIFVAAFAHAFDHV